MPFKMHTPLRHIRRAGLLFTALAASTTLSLAQSTSGIGPFVPNTELGFSPVAAAGEPRINWINGEYQETNKDLSVKVLGGSIDISRSWSQGRWWLNPAWAPLNFEIDPLGQDIKVIERVGTIYERSGQTHLYMASAKGRATVFIKKVYDGANQQMGWQWYDRLGNTIDYSLDGRIQSYADPSGVKVSFAYDSATSARILDHWGRTIYTVTMAGGLITKIDDLAGRSVHYQWQGNLLTQATDVMGNAWTYSYDANGQITGRTDPLGAQVSAQYIQSFPAPEPMLSLGKVGKTVDPTGTSGTTQKLANIWGGGRVGKFDGQGTCSSSGVNHYIREKRIFEVTWTDCRGNVTLYVYDLQGNELNRTFNGKQTARNQWDGKYTQRNTNARGLTTTTYYDTNYQPLQIIYPDGSVEKYSYEPQFGRKSSYTNQLGVVSTWSYDSKGNVTEWVEAKGTSVQRVTINSFNEYGQLKKEVISKDGDESKPEVVITTYSYDDFGSVSSITDAEGNITKFTYDAVGNLKSSTDPQGRSSIFTYNQRNQMLSRTSPMGHISFVTYDVLGRREKIIDPLGHFIRTTYDQYGRIKTEADEEGNLISFEYDHYGNLIKTTTAEGVVNTAQYDEIGRLIAQADSHNNKINYIYGEKGASEADLLISILYPNGLRVTNQYDQKNRRTVVAQKADKGLGVEEELKTITIYDVADREVATISPAGNINKTEYDERNRIVKKIDANGHETQYVYDIQDNQIEVIDANQNVHRFNYDKLKRLKEEIRPEGGKTSYEYDQVGQLKKRITPDGDIGTFEYDDDGRVTKEAKISHLSEGRKAKLSQAVTYTYNAAGQRTGYVQKNGEGQLISQASYTLDKLGRTKQENFTYGAGSKQIALVISQAWNRDGQKISQTYPDGNTSTFTYDKEQLKTASQPGSTNEINWSSYEWSLPKEIFYPGVKRINVYDGFYRYKNIDVKSVAAAPVSILNLGYQYDLDSNITKIQRHVGQNIQGITDYGYDSLDRLTQAMPSQSLKDLGLPVEKYTYDPVHNRKSSAHQPGEWIYKIGNRLSQWGEEQSQIIYEYGDSGNIIKEVNANADLARTYEYDAAERLIAVKDTNQTIATYQYDPMNRRISKTVGVAPNQQITYFVYSDEGLLAEINEMEDTHYQAKSYGWEPNAPWGTKLLWHADHIQMPPTSRFHYVHYDHLGTPQISTNELGQETWSMVSESFGEAIVSSTASTVLNMRFPGQYFDDETGGHYNFHRDYNPVTGRYRQSDPIGLSGGQNFYSYSLATPVMRLDYYGLSSCETEVVGSILTIKPTSEWFTNIRPKTAYRDSPHGKIPAIGVYELHSSGRFVAAIKCVWTTICCATENKISFEASATSPTIPASFEYDEIHLAPRSWVKYVKAGQILGKLYHVAKESQEYKKWFMSLDVKKICGG